LQKLEVRSPGPQKLQSSDDGDDGGGVSDGGDDDENDEDGSDNDVHGDGSDGGGDDDSGEDDADGVSNGSDDGGGVMMVMVMIVDLGQLSDRTGLSLPTCEVGLMSVLPETKVSSFLKPFEAGEEEQVHRVTGSASCYVNLCLVMSPRWDSGEGRSTSLNVKSLIYKKG
jgi:hypothetical protein